MNPAKVKREHVRCLTDLPNVASATEKDLHLLGIREPSQLVGRNPFTMHAQLSELTGVRQDPCVIDVFMSIVRFAEGDEPRPWWHYTAERKAYLARL